jgi:UDP-GlcNAc:undecaprenyl-phosphate GlcNAc-1-phosphate transferase
MQIMQVVFLSFITAFLLSIILTPLVKRAAVMLHVCALPNHRTIHHRIVPKLGGIAIFFSFMITLLAALYFYYGTLDVIYHHLMGLMLGATFILALGIYDDVKGVNCYQKLTVQAIAAIIAISFGYQISSIRTLFGGTIDLGIWSIPLTILWIAGISNAINLIDGLDGLAAGISLGVAFTFFLIALMFGDVQVVFATAILAAVIAGFLIYNFNPAKIFMGDSGSLLIGFLLACFAIDGIDHPSSAVKILIPIIAMGVPIMDTLLAIIRRLVKGVSPFHADKEHIHHRLLYLGLSQRKAVMLLYLVSAFFGVAAFLVSVVDIRLRLILLSFVIAVILLGITQLTLPFRNGKKKMSPEEVR